MRHTGLKDLGLLKEIALYVAQNHNRVKRHPTALSEAEIAAFVETLAGVTVSAAAQEIGDGYLKALNAMIVFDGARVSRAAARRLAAIAALSGHLGSARKGIVLLRSGANSQGILDMGVGADAGAVLDQLKTGAVKGLYVYGEDLDAALAQAVRSQVEYLVVQDAYLTDLAASADVVLPMALPFETAGTFTSTDRGVKAFPAVLEPAFPMENWEMIQALVNMYTTNADYDSAEAITAEILRTHPVYNSIRKELESGGTACWSTGASKILYDGHGGAAADWKSLSTAAPAFEAAVETNVTKKRFKALTEAYREAKCGGSCGGCTGVC